MPYFVGGDGSMRNNVTRAQHVQGGPGYFTDTINSFGHFHSSTGISIAGSTWTSVTFNTAQALRMTYSGTTVTVAIPGLYMLTGQISFSAAAAVRYAGWRVTSNLQGVIGGEGPDEIANSYVMPKGGGFFAQLSAGEQITFQVYHNHTSALTLAGGSAGNRLSLRLF